MRIVYLIRSISSGQYYFEGLNPSMSYFIPNGELAKTYLTYEDAEQEIRNFGYVGLFEIVECYLKKL